MSWAVIVQLLGEQWVIGLVQLIAGKLIKDSAAGKLNPFIPVLNAILAAIGFQILPASAEAAGFIGSLFPIKEGLSVVGLSILQTVMVTGTHSTFKNTVVPGLKVGLGWVFGRLAPWLQSK